MSCSIFPTVVCHFDALGLCHRDAARLLLATICYWATLHLDLRAILIDGEMRLEMGTLEDQHSLCCQVPINSTPIPARKHLPRRAAPRRHWAAWLPSHCCFEREMHESKHPSSKVCSSSPREAQPPHYQTTKTLISLSLCLLKLWIKTSC